MATNLKKQNSNMSTDTAVSITTNQQNLGDESMVMEREFRGNCSHSDQINCITRISPSEFISSSNDNSFKIWDKDLQGCSYTYETHEPLDSMEVTGEKMN
jgi:WD40 repeat protein